MELFEEVSPAALAKSGDGSRFRSAGQWKTGVFDGLEYLETGKGMNDRYAIRFTVPSEVPLWVFEVTFPDDVARSADISVQNARTGAIPSTTATRPASSIRTRARTSSSASSTGPPTPTARRRRRTSPSW